MHRILERQIRKHLGDAPDVSPELRALFVAISEALEHTDEDRLLLERSIELSSKEYAKVTSEINAAKSELEAHAALLKTTLESTADGILVVDTFGGIVEWNDRFATMWNVPLSLITEKDDKKVFALIQSQLVDSGVFPMKMEHVDVGTSEESFDELELKDGRIFERFSLPEKMGNRSVGRVWSFRDVTTRKRAEEHLKDEKATIERLVQEQTRQIVEDKRILDVVAANMVHGTLLLSTTGEVIFMNELLRDMLGEHLTDGDAVRALSAKFPAVNIQARIDACLAEKGTSLVPEVESGASVYELLTRYISGEGEHAGSIIVFVRDVTAQKREERSKQEFFSIASHELRTPLTAIRGNASMIHDFYEKEMPGDMKEMVDDILESSERLITIVNDFLDISRLEQKRMVFHIADFDLIALLKKTVDELRSLSEKKNLSLVANLPHGELIARADKDRIKQILINLIANAINYTEVGSVTVTTRVDGKFVKVLVTDTGVGISKISQGLLFKKFQQAGDSIFTRTTMKGTGLGLYISRLMATEMGGTVQIEESIQGVGSTFSLVIPLEKVVSGGDNAVRGDIFLIVDDREIARMYERMFRMKGYGVAGASDGSSALLLLHGMPNKPVAIVLDALLRSPSGIDTLRALKNDEKLKSIPVSVVTNTLERGNDELYLSLGASLVVTKMDDNLEEVIDRVNDAVHIGE